MKKLICITGALILSALAFCQDTITPAMAGELDIEELARRLANYSGHASEEDAVMTSVSTINWTKNTFTSSVSLDVAKAGIPMPSGKSSSVNKIQMELPALVKDPLLSIYVDNTRTLGDLVLEETVTLEELTRIIDSSKQTPAYFENGTNNLVTQHTIQLQNIGASLVKHKVAYTQRVPIDTVASKAYTGIIIDARGMLPVHGEFVEDRTYPCIFPKIWSEDMDLIYERNMVEPQIVKERGSVLYSSSRFVEDYEDRVGKKPLWITAKKVYGINRTDAVISRNDYLQITSVKENMELLRKGKVVILLDKDVLIHGVAAPDKNKRYYVAYEKLKRYVLENPIPDTFLLPGPSGFRFKMENLKFIADSPKLLPEEQGRISQIAQSIKKYVVNGEFTILVEGHTADVNKPEGQLQLSIQRAQTIIQALVDEGVDSSLFTYKGYGGTKPIASNTTPEGRAQNRRVEIQVMPKSGYVQRVE
ncbi:OmpA family protein [Treponema sp.]|uniref:OmpA family protein n=1 Tax=Treponema sp. TaxID=166 RepID=UPI0025DB68F2|nr:OmpA family protein [Treponema sp.]MCR5219351.1 OmpA family protein [Treponema sp.]